MSIYQKLFDWQKSVVDKFKSRQSFGLFLDCGLGKTPLSLAFAEENKCHKTIVITINSKACEDESIQGSWFDWGSQSSESYDIKGKNESTFGYKTSLLFITNYESLFKRNSSSFTLSDKIKAFINVCVDENVAVILDESHKLKNLQSKQTKAVLKLINNLKLKRNKVFTYLLTGTPFTTGYIDLYAQLKILGCDMLKGDFVDKFCERGNIPGLFGWQQPIVGYKNINELFDLVHQYAITIDSKDVVNLPDQIFNYYTTPYSNVFKLLTNERLKTSIINEELKKRHQNLLSESKEVSNNPFYRNIAYPDLKWLGETTGIFWLRARQLSIGFNGNAEKSEWYDKTRLNQVKVLLEQNEDNYVLFYNFVPEMIELYNICEELGYNIDVYCGEVKSMIFYTKYSVQTKEQRLTNKKNIILANFASGSTGMNWQLYNKCILFSLPLYKDWIQSIKRVHRTGQTSTVIYHIFYQNNWLDKSMMKSLEESKQYSNDMFEADLKRINSIIKEN